MDVQPMTINGHLLLLVLATGVFVRLWNANSHTQLSAVAPTTRQTVIASPPELAPVTAATAVVHRPVAVSATTTVPAEENWTAANCPIPLPAGISVGTYRVVDDTGRVARLEVAAVAAATGESNSRAVPNSPEVRASFNIVSFGTERWYFIRLQSPVALNVREDSDERAISDAPNEIELNACPFQNRKFDFTGYETSSQTDESAVDGSVSEEIARPESPELPIQR